MISGHPAFYPVAIQSMISDTQDILYLVLAFCVLWFTIFVCWLLYYFIAIMREARGTVKDLRERISRITAALEEIKEKFTSSLAIFSGLADGVKFVMNYLTERRTAHRAAPKKRKTVKVEEGEIAEKI